MRVSVPVEIVLLVAGYQLTARVVAAGFDADVGAAVGGIELGHHKGDVDEATVHRAGEPASVGTRAREPDLHTVHLRGCGVGDGEVYVDEPVALPLVVPLVGRDQRQRSLVGGVQVSARTEHAGSVAGLLGGRDVRGDRRADAQAVLASRVFDDGGLPVGLAAAVARAPCVVDLLLAA